MKVLLFSAILVLTPSAFALNAFENFKGTYYKSGTPEVTKVNTVSCKDFNFQNIESLTIKTRILGDQTHTLEIKTAELNIRYPVMDFYRLDPDGRSGTLAKADGEAHYAYSEFKYWNDTMKTVEILTANIEKQDNHFIFSMTNERFINEKLSTGCYYKVNMKSAEANLPAAK